MWLTTRTMMPRLTSLEQLHRPDFPAQGHQVPASCSERGHQGWRFSCAVEDTVWFACRQSVLVSPHRDAIGYPRLDPDLILCVEAGPVLARKVDCTGGRCSVVHLYTFLCLHLHMQIIRYMSTGCHLKPSTYGYFSLAIDYAMIQQAHISVASSRCMPCPTVCNTKQTIGRLLSVR